MRGAIRSVAGGLAMGAMIFAAAIDGKGDTKVLQGRAQVADGDDIIVDARKVRLSGVDAFEWDQMCQTWRGDAWPCGSAAKALLASIVGDRRVACEIHSWSKEFKRYNGVCRLDGTDIAGLLVSAGLAFDVPKWSGGRYKVLEDEARAKKVGAWAGKFTYPWEHRRAKREAEKGDPT